MSIRPFDRNCQLRFRVNGAEMGSIVDEPVSNVEVYVRVSDPDADDAISKIELFEDGKVVATDMPDKNARCVPFSRAGTGAALLLRQGHPSGWEDTVVGTGVGDGEWGVAASGIPVSRLTLGG